MNIDFTKYSDGLAPAVIQDDSTGKVLMVGFMNQEAFDKTHDSGKVTFYSRTKKRLWTKGEESGNFLYLKACLLDCDNDTILIKADPAGPVCHTGADTCFNEKNVQDNFLPYLEEVIEQRKTLTPDKSYVASLFKKGLNKIAQKVGEEAVEVVIEAKDDNEDLFLNESADLLFHYLILLNAKGYKLHNVIHQILQKRHTK